jgi:hypothetical protein
LRHEGYLTGERADEVDGRLSELQDALASWAGRLREALRAGPESSLSASLWSHGTSPQSEVISDSDATGGLFLC